VNHTEHNAKTPHTATGLFATLRGLLHAQGTGASSPRYVLATLSVLATTLGVLAFSTAAAHAEECPNAVFRTGPSAHLPDCRAYEQVSPPFKNTSGARLFSYSPGGTSAGLILTTALTETEGFVAGGAGGTPDYFSVRRTASGWATVSDGPPTNEYVPGQTGGSAGDFLLGDLDGQTTLWLDRAASQPNNSISFFLRLPDRSIVDVGPAAPPTTPAGTPFEVSDRIAHVEVAGLSSDASHLLFTLGGDYWPFDDTETGQTGKGGSGGGNISLYEYVGTGNTTPMLVGVNNAGALISRCGTELGAGESFSAENTYNAMSADGQTIFFNAPCGQKTRNELYARIDNDEPGARTVDISEPTREDCSTCNTEAGVLAAASFEGASEDGSKVFFTTTQPLLDGTGGLYEYDFEAPAGEKISLVVPGAVSMEGHGVEVSEDGSHVYFESSKVLTEAPNAEGEKAQPGPGNTYVYNTETGQITFVAGGGTGQSNVTPDGRFLVFTSDSHLTSDDTAGAEQVFEYDAQTGALVRVSAGQEGFNNNGNVPTVRNGYNQVLNNASLADSYGRNESAYNEPYNSSWAGTSVSADGSYVFFQSIVGLTPQALDRKLVGTRQGYTVYANNVYEYHDGQVSLISDGQDLSSVEETSNVVLLGADESGSDVLFTTADQLVGQDTDTAIDIYDARIDGGFPGPTAPSQCSGESCQGPLSGAPTLLSPGSEFQAGGNPPLAEPAPAPVSKPKAKAKATKCKKGTKLEHGKCVKTKVKKATGKRRARS
jgi:hypothetical protein